MRILVVGAGAVGGLFGGLMAAHGRDVTFLARDGRADQLRRRGLELIGTPGGPQDEVRAVPVAVLTADELPGPTRSTSCCWPSRLRAGPGDPRPRAAVDAGAAVLPVLNGMRHVDVLADGSAPTG